MTDKTTVLGRLRETTSRRDVEIAALREELAQANVGVDTLLEEVGVISAMLQAMVDRQETQEPDYKQGVLDALAGIGTALMQVRGHQALVERYYRELQHDFRGAMRAAVCQAQDVNAETGELVASLHVENRQLRELLGRMADRLGLDESLSIARQVQFAAGAGHGTG